MVKENKIQKRIVIFIWSVLFFLTILMLSLNMIDRVNNENLLKHVLSYVLVIVIFIPSIVIYLFNAKNTNYTFLKNVIFLLFIFTAFISIIEAGFNSKQTQVQVQNLIQSIQNIKKNPKIKEFTINILDKKEEYEIGDKISYEIIITPKKTNLDRIVCEVDNKIVEVHLKDKEIECINDGICNITFYDSLNKEIQFKIQIKIKNNGLEKIELNKEKNIFLKAHEQFNLQPTTNLSLTDELNLSYESSNPDVAIVDENGKISALKSGETTIKCYCGDIYDEVYVYVNALTKIDFVDDEIKVLTSKIGSTKIKLYIDNMDTFKKANLKFEFGSDYNINIKMSTISTSGKYVLFELVNTDKHSVVDEIINLKVFYEFKGGYFVEDTLNINIVPDNELSIENIDINKTKEKVNLTLYYDGEELVTKYATKTIYYNVNVSTYNVKKIKVTSDQNIKFLKVSYNSITFAFEDDNIISDKYFIKFYPNEKNDEYIQLEFNIIKKQITNFDSSFELKNLYEKNENLKNEIWYSYFNANVFNSIVYNNKEFNNSGIVIIPSENVKNYLNLEFNEYGIVTKCSLINRDKMQSPEEATLEFEICSLYEYNKNINCDKYKYVINIRSEYDSLLISINDGEYTSDVQNIIVTKDDEIEIKSKLIATLENKTKNKKIESTSKILKKYSNSKNIEVNSNYIKFKEYGELEIKYYTNKTYCEKSFELKVNILVVDENGEIPIKKTLTFDVISYEKNCAPLIEKNTFSTGTHLKFNIEKKEQFRFVSSNNQILSIDEEGNAICLQTGNVSVYAINKDNEDEIYSYVLKIYSAVNKVEIINTNFSKITKQNNNYVLKIKNNVVYQFEFSNTNDIKYRYSVVEKDGFTMFDDGKFQATKSGRYEGYILIGEEDSPYKQKIKFVINSDVIGLSDDTIYFIRKLVGHFGLFMALGFFGMLMLSLFKYFNFKYKIILIIALVMHGILVAYSTEFIQGLDPTRTNAFKDVLINCSGYFCGLMVIGIVILVKNLIIRFIKNCSNAKLNEGKN